MWAVAQVSLEILYWKPNQQCIVSFHYVADFFLHGRSLTVLPFVGSAIVVAGLFVMHEEGAQERQSAAFQEEEDELERDNNTLLSKR